MRRRTKPVQPNYSQTKSIIRECMLTFIYPDESYKKSFEEYNEIKQYITNLLNLCSKLFDIYAVFPSSLHKAIPFVNLEEGREVDSLKFKKEYLEFQKKSIEVNKKLNKLITIKLLRE